VQPAISQGKFGDLRGKLDLDLQGGRENIEKSNVTYRIGLALRIRCLRTRFRDTDVAVGRV
jgi:hypothetical protein